MDLVVFALGVKASSVRVLFYYHQWLGAKLPPPNISFTKFAALEEM